MNSVTSKLYCKSRISRLNAILDLNDPIISAQILKPFNYQEFAESKQIALDVRCRDCLGRYFNVEIQVSVYAGLVQRLADYACSIHLEQLSKGGSYALLTPSISICLLSRVLFADTLQALHRFEMLNQESGRKLESTIEVHTLD